MHTIRQIPIFVALTLCAISPVLVNGKTKSKKSNNKHGYVVGFQFGKELDQRSLWKTADSKQLYAQNTTKSFFIWKNMGRHIELESGLRYTTTPESGYYPPQQRTFYQRRSVVSIPVTMDYFMLSDQSKIRPYCGVGFQCNSDQTKTNIAQPFNDGGTQLTNNDQPGTRLISIIFTQGVTYEVNTRIQFTQSFHFLPQNNGPKFGLDIGIGFKIN